MYASRWCSPRSGVSVVVFGIPSSGWKAWMGMALLVANDFSVDCRSYVYIFLFLDRIQKQLHMTIDAFL